MDRQRTCFKLLYTWNRKLSEAAILELKDCSTGLCAWVIIGSFQEEICTSRYAVQLKWS